MNYTQAAEIIKGTVSAKATAEMLGYQIGRSGFMVCPFHGDKDASLKVYDGKGGHTGWHCFGCGRGGSCIDFVMESENCGFQRAVRILNDGMGLNLLTVENMFDQDKQRRIRRAMDGIRDSMNAVIDARMRHIDRMQQFLTKWLQYLEDIPKQERTEKQYTRILLILEEMQYNDYLLDKCDELKLEVSEWRSRIRSGKSP